MNYQNGKIYKIYSSETDEIYIGSTTATLKERLERHYKNLKRYEKGDKKCYTSSFDILKYGNVNIELIENFPCNSNKELRIREQYFIKNNNCVNINNAYRSENENKKKRSIYNKTHYEKNKEKIKNDMKKKYSCECGGKYTHTHKLRHMETKKHLHFVENGEILKFKCKMSMCDCGVLYSKINKKRHLLSKTHIKNINL